MELDTLALSGRIGFRSTEDASRSFPGKWNAWVSLGRGKVFGFW